MAKVKTAKRHAAEDAMLVWRNVLSLRLNLVEDVMTINRLCMTQPGVIQLTLGQPNVSIKCQPRERARGGHAT